MLINEIFDTRIPVNQWTRQGNTEVGILDIDGEEFHIILEERHYTFQSRVLNFINAAFAKIVDGKQSQKLVGSSKYAGKILGAIFHAVTDKVKSRDDIDAIVFVARDNVTKRMSLYNQMASNMFNPFTDVIRDVPLPEGGKMTILLKNIVDKDLVSAFEEYLTTLEK